MENNMTDFHLKAKEIWSKVAKSNIGYTRELELQLDLHRKLLNVFQVGDYYYVVFNIYKGEIEFVSDEVTHVTGYEPQDFTVSLILQNIHPDDKSYFLNYENASIEFFKKLPFDKIKKYKAQYDYRIKAKNNTYVRVLQQVMQIDYDETNFYRSFCIHTDITHVKKEGVPHLSIIGLEGEPCYYNIGDAPTFKRSYDLFTNRERDILKCIVQSKSSKQIASELSISLHTVNTHRKNILKKAECASPIDLISTALAEGWV